MHAIIIKRLKNNKIVKKNKNKARANHTSHATLLAKQTMHPCKKII